MSGHSAGMQLHLFSIFKYTSRVYSVQRVSIMNLSFATIKESLVSCITHVTQHSSCITHVTHRSSAVSRMSHNTPITIAAYSVVNMISMIVYKIFVNIFMNNIIFIPTIRFLNSIYIHRLNK